MSKEFSQPIEFAHILCAEHPLATKYELEYVLTPSDVYDILEIQEVKRLIQKQAEDKK